MAITHSALLCVPLTNQFMVSRRKILGVVFSVSVHVWAPLPIRVSNLDLVADDTLVSGATAPVGDSGMPATL